MTLAADRPRRGLEIARIIFWSGLSNMALLLIFFTAQSNNIPAILRQQAATLGHAWLTAESSIPASMADSGIPAKVSLNLSAHFRHSTVPDPSSAKGSRPMTVVAETDAAPAQATLAGAGTIDGTEASAALSPPPTMEETRGLRVSPILRKNPVTSMLEIGNFKSLALAGDSQECLDVGYSMLGDVNTSTDLLDVMIASDEITIAKICTSNGSVMITCRNEQIAVSPRRSRPDDQCQRAS